MNPTPNGTPKGTRRKQCDYCMEYKEDAVVRDHPREADAIVVACQECYDEVTDNLPNRRY